MEKRVCAYMYVCMYVCVCVCVCMCVCVVGNTSFSISTLENAEGCRIIPHRNEQFYPICPSDLSPTLVDSTLEYLPVVLQLQLPFYLVGYLKLSYSFLFYTI